MVEGRDIGTTVVPDADVKVFLTASEQARAARRAAEHSDADPEATRVDQARRTGSTPPGRHPRCGGRTTLSSGRHRPDP